MPRLHFNLTWLLRYKIVLSKGIAKLRSTDRLLEEFFDALLGAELGETLQLVAGAHEDDWRLELLSLALGSTFLAADDHELQEGRDLVDDLDTGHFGHLKLSDKKINRLPALLLQCVVHDEVNGSQATREQLNLRLAAKVK